MSANDISTQVRVILEEELGEFRAFADLPATEIDLMAARLTRALEPVLAKQVDVAVQRVAA